MNNLSLILLALWLLISGFTQLVPLSVPSLGLILNLLALAAGLLMLIEHLRIRLPDRMGYLLLSLWLVATGLLPLLNIHFQGSGSILALLALLAGVLLLLRR